MNQRLTKSQKAQLSESSVGLLRSFFFEHLVDHKGDCCNGIMASGTAFYVLQYDTTENRYRALANFQSIPFTGPE